MAESNWESRIQRIVCEGKHRWLRSDEICEVLRNLNGVAISEKPADMPPSGSIFLFDKKVEKHFRNDGYKWKKGKDGRKREAHERLKVEGLDTLHCYYAHGEEDENFQRRSYWMLEENLSHRVLVHYRDVKGEKRKDRHIEETESAEGVQHSRKTDKITPNSEMDSFASSSFNRSNFQHSQATDGTNLNSALTSESENTVSAYPLPEINARYPDRSHPLIRTNCNGREVKEAVSSCFVPTNFQMHQTIDMESLSDVYTSDFEDAQSACDDFSFCKKTVSTGFSEIGPSLEMDYFGSPRFVDTTSLYSANSSNFGDDETELAFADEFWGRPWSTFADEFWGRPWSTSFDNYVTAGFSPSTYSRASSSVAVEPSPLGKRQRDSAASEEGKSQATHNATMEEVDKQKDEEEEGNDINQVRKRPKVTCGQKSNSVGFSNDSEEATLAVGTAPPEVQEFNFAIQQGEVSAGNNPAASDVAVTIDRAITDGAMNYATVLSQAQPPVPQPTATIGVDIAAATNKIATPESSNPALVQSRPTSNANQDQPQMPTIGVDISAATNKTAAPESSDPALVQTRPTSNANQGFVQDVESQEKETEPTSFEPENGKGKIMVQRDVGTEKFQIQDSPSIIQAQEDDATTRLAAFSITDRSGAASLARGPIHLNPDTIANVVDRAQDSQPTVTMGIVISATTNETAASESSNHALVQWEPTSNANQDFAQDVVESQEKGTEPTSIEPENGKSKALVQRDFGTGKSHKFSEVVVTSSHKRLLELLDRASAPNTLASSSSSTPTIDSQAIATTRATLEMDFITMAGEVERTHMISCIQCLIDSNCFPTGTRPVTLAILKQLEQSVPAYSEAYSEYDMGKNLADQVEATKQLLQPKVQFCDSKNREILELEEKKMKIEARQAAIQAEIDGAVKETEPIQACLEKLLQKQDQFKKNEGNLKNILDIGDGLWTTLKSIIHRHLPT